MENKSPFLAMQQVETQLKSLLRHVDVDLLTPDEKKFTANIRRHVVDARLDVRDYELSETRAEQLKKAREAKKHLGKLRTALLALGSVFGPADIAQTDAQLEQIEVRLV